MTIAATFSACARSVAASHGPGTTRTGVTPPSSLVSSFARSGLPRARRYTRSGPGGPHASASWVRIEPVMWTSSTPGWCARWAPSSAPP